MSKIFYSKGFSPNTFNDVNSELIEIEKAFRDLSASVPSETTYTSPDKPREFMIKWADGVSWNPRNLGAGLYIFIGGQWMKFKLE